MSDWVVGDTLDCIVVAADKVSKKRKVNGMKTQCTLGCKSGQSCLIQKEMFFMTDMYDSCQ